MGFAMAPPIVQNPAARANRVRVSALQIARAHQAGAASLPVAIAFGLALVGLALAVRDAEFDLGAAALVEIDRQRYDRDPLALDRAEESVHLLSVQQQFARPCRLVVEMRRGLVFRDVGVDEIKL